MLGDRSVTVFYDDVMLGHNPQVDLPFLPSRVEKRVRNILKELDFKWSYPEHPGRLSAIKELLDAEPIPGLQFNSGPHASYDQLGRVHTTAYLDHIFSLEGKPAWLDRDTTAVSEHSIKAATSAAGNAIAAVECVVKGESQSAFALVRPPGHHAEPVRARGFCLFNNVAVAAAHAQAKLGCERILIVDWDAHHGNGTQDIFYHRDDVLTLSIHGHPSFAYPYFAGFADETGISAGTGFNVNYPLPETCSVARYQRTLERTLKRIRAHQPAYLVLALGLDTARDDPTGTWQFGVADFRENGRAVGRLGIPTLIVQEGGYRTRTLGQNARAFFEGLVAGRCEYLEENGVAGRK